MTERFENLNPAALHTADEALAHIAETASVSPEIENRIAVRTMEKAGFAAPQKQTVIRHKKRPKHIAALIAAVLSAAVLAIGVGGYLRYNQRALEKNFGALGTAKLADMQLAEPKTYTNGTVNATVEAVLCDGTHAFVLTTFKTAVPAQDVNWYLQLHCFYEKGQPDQPYHTVFPDDCMIQVFDNEAWVTWGIDLAEHPANDTLTLCFQKHETQFPTEELIEEVKREGGMIEDLYESKEFVGSTAEYFNDLTDGLEIEIPLTANVPVVTLRADSGKEIRMSGFEMLSSKGSIDARDGEEITIYRKDGSAASGKIRLVFDNTARYIETIEGVSYRFDKPESYIGFTDVTNVSAVEMDGVLYSGTDSPA